jgi:hypothetical protein
MQRSAQFVHPNAGFLSQPTLQIRPFSQGFALFLRLHHIFT